MKVLQKRLLKRAKTSGRADDNMETIKKRFDTFLNTSMPVIDYYEKQGKVAKISAEPAPEKIFKQVSKSLQANGFSPA